MSRKYPISVFIIAHNEADRIATTINSVTHWVDEVIVVDSGSSDNTVQVAQALGARTLHQDWLGYGLQKRFGEDQCKNRWILNLDADEEVTPALAAEIQQIFEGGEPIEAGFILRVCDLLPGEEILALFPHVNDCLRLYNRECGRFSDSPVHDSVIIEKGVTRKLARPVLHRSFRNLAHAIGKMNHISNVQAAHLQERGLSLPLLRLCIEFPMAFLKTYLLRGYILRGRVGFIYAMHYAYARFARIAKYMEKAS